MLKINSYRLLLFSALFYVNSANVLHGSSDSSQKSSIIPQPCRWQFNSSIDTLIPFSSNPNNVTNTFNNNTTPFILSPTQEQEILNEPSDAIATAQVEQSLFPDIYQDSESATSIPSLFPSGSITSQPYNWPNSSTNTFIPPFALSSWDANSSMNTFADFNNINTFPFILHESRNFDDACANMSNGFSLLISDGSILSNTMTTSANVNKNSIHPAVSHAQRQAVSPTNQHNNQALSKNKKHTKTHTCPTCHKNLRSLNGYKYHLKTHNPNRTRPFKCSLCDKSFTEKCILKTHIKGHNNEKPFQCDFCNKCFRTKQRKITHHLIHRGEKPFQCDFCKKRFRTLCAKNSHVRQHTGKGLLECGLCQQKLSSKHALEYHLSKHKGEKPYKCTQCDKAFRDKSRLKEHKLTHKGDGKPYKCRQCTKAYTTKNGLRLHLKAHNKIKQYTCTYCDSAFSCKNKYKRHIKYEESTNEDRKCHICKKVYANKYILQEHNKKAHSKT